jgi:hypothetical protein
MIELYKLERRRRRRKLEGGKLSKMNKLGLQRVKLNRITKS